MTQSGHPMTGLPRACRSSRAVDKTEPSVLPDASPTRIERDHVSFWPLTDVPLTLGVRFWG
jgi:hypothetical protein